jgi:hypothetical protein
MKPPKNEQVHNIISQHRSPALQTINKEHLLTAWEVGAYVSTRLKNLAWGSKTVMQLSEYLRAQDPTLQLIIGSLRSNCKKRVFVCFTFFSRRMQEFYGLA